jgi:hypothetical protein
LSRKHEELVKRSLKNKSNHGKNLLKVKKTKFQRKFSLQLVKCPVE